MKYFHHIYLFSALVWYVLRTFNIESFEKFAIENYSLSALRWSSNASFLLGTIIIVHPTDKTTLLCYKKNVLQHHY